MSDEQEGLETVYSLLLLHAAHTGFGRGGNHEPDTLGHRHLVSVPHRRPDLSLIEYGLHRLVFHFDAQSEKGRKFVYGMHLSHHSDPKSMDDLFASLRLSLPLAISYCLLAWALTRSWQATVYLFIGLTAGYFSYEFLHYQAHHRSSRLGVLRYLKKYHLLHHHKSSALHFGVTSPVFDYLFGTFQSTPETEL